ncbi:MAG: hypothetical protein EXR58_05030 [Chloroflexi bacterium]|nr:hypothetical protein [Chloroflexota bacterium]
MEAATTPTLGRVFKTLQSFYWGSPRTTFVVNPITVFLIDSLIERRVKVPDLRFLPLLLWGNLQYRLVGSYRAALGGGPGGVSRGLPEVLVTDGLYGLTRNPMYLGHLIFSLGLFLAFRSPSSALLALGRLVYFVRRVDLDEDRLESAFGDPYRVYKRRVRRWIPGVL